MVANYPQILNFFYLVLSCVVIKESRRNHHKERVCVNNISVDIFATLKVQQTRFGATTTNAVTVVLFISYFGFASQITQ